MAVAIVVIKITIVTKKTKGLPFGVTTPPLWSDSSHATVRARSEHGREGVSLTGRVCKDGI